MKKNLFLVTLVTLFTIFSSSIQANLLSNPGFEAGLTGWSSSGNATIRTGDPAPYEGSNYIYGADTPSFRVWQDLNLLNLGFSSSEIDTGDLDVEFGGWQSGWDTQQDNGQIFVHLFDTNMMNIGDASLPSFYSNHTWVEQSGVTDLLSGTRFISYEFVGTRLSGANNDGYLDAAYLNISNSLSVPLPATFLLIGTGLICLFLRKRHVNTKFLDSTHITF